MQLTDEYIVPEYVYDEIFTPLSCVRLANPDMQDAYKPINRQKSEKTAKIIVIYQDHFQAYHRNAQYGNYKINYQDKHFTNSAQDSEHTSQACYPMKKYNYCNNTR